MEEEGQRWLNKGAGQKRTHKWVQSSILRRSACPHANMHLQQPALHPWLPSKNDTQGCLIQLILHPLCQDTYKPSVVDGSNTYRGDNGMKGDPLNLNFMGRNRTNSELPQARGFLHIISVRNHVPYLDQVHFTDLRIFLVADVTTVYGNFRHEQILHPPFHMLQTSVVWSQMNSRLQKKNKVLRRFQELCPHFLKPLRCSS